MRTPLLLVSLFAIALPGCSDDAGSGEPDAAVGQPDGNTGVDANLDCLEPTSVLESPFGPVNMVSSAAVENQGAGLAVVDGTAGGLMNAPENPAIYIRFGDPADMVAKVDVTDTAAYSDDSWDLSFKRYLIRANGGDSGPGGVSIAIVAAATLDEVTAVPGDNEFSEDDWVTESCELIRDSLLGAPNTAVGVWYNYDQQTHMLSPMEQVYVVKRRDGTAFKLRIVSWDHMGMTGNYQIEWAAF